jgi:hypothetical protein
MAWFNVALLTGTGSVMPDYTVPGTANAGGGGGGSMNSASSTSGTKNITTTVEVNEAGGPIDVTALSGALVYAISTAQ